ncbi:hypothetical protein JG687_00010977 [Phytophthora cactorum]|uniref:Uncharacterized protein n=1 Tax=Phytophthora cactorum TaxID=29920 RepID=A0A8T1U5T9_9STRA|nr:hypothetical protein PC120_g16715 [Phytophthora cactorum]KAG3087150.1 hypothetical protein PC121_g4706 [Phytophthora cactorum]KAG3193407.1 hypothetical protein PC128_g10164 [Phytophthora cactorum]KAG4043557.1 hypothetical protein PC123_g20977 [Phytophthora cactorum]KAG6955788.1 hypothetical protein JG687_00010977 [Phytophthora cactorum]
MVEVVTATVVVVDFEDALGFLELDEVGLSADAERFVRTGFLLVVVVLAMEAVVKPGSSLSS